MKTKYKWVDKRIRLKTTKNTISVKYKILCTIKRRHQNIVFISSFYPKTPRKTCVTCSR